jgi:hypothetical protein
MITRSFTLFNVFNALVTLKRSKQSTLHRFDASYHYDPIFLNLEHNLLIRMNG